MTTAHRPTFDPARGKDSLRGPAYHQRLLPAHTLLKYRQEGQGGAAGDGGRDLRAELLRAEAAAKRKRIGSTEDDVVDEPQDANKVPRIDNGAARDNDSPAGGAESEEEDPEARRRRLILEEAHDIDADSDGGGEESEESSEEEDDEDEEAELMRELAKIKAERAAQKLEEEQAQAAKEAEQREVDIARGNPLLNKQDFGVRRRWDDDVVFKNQGRGTEEKGKRKEFVNDLLRSDFHKRFMSRYVR